MKKNNMNSEALFLEAYQMMEDERNKATLVADTKFLNPLKKSFHLKNPKAIFLLGYILAVGFKDLEMDVNKGNKLLKKAYPLLKDLVDNNQDALASKFLALYYQVPLSNFVKDQEKVDKYLKLAKSFEVAKGAVLVNEEQKIDNLNHLDSYQYLLKLINSLNEIDPSLNKESIAKLDSLTKAGNIRACLFLGDLYLEGKYVIKNDDLALDYYKLAEKLGSIKAKYDIGKYLLEGNYSKVDITKGLNYIYQAAKAGLKEAEFYLGNIYFEGKLVEKNFSKAYLYYQASLTRGMSEAKEKLKILEEKRGEEILNNLINKETN